MKKSYIPFLLWLTSLSIVWIFSYWYGSEVLTWDAESLSGWTSCWTILIPNNNEPGIITSDLIKWVKKDGTEIKKKNASKKNKQKKQEKQPIKKEIIKKEKIKKQKKTNIILNDYITVQPHTVKLSSQCGKDNQHKIQQRMKEIYKEYASHQVQASVARQTPLENEIEYRTEWKFSNIVQQKVLVQWDETKYSHIVHNSKYIVEASDNLNKLIIRDAKEPTKIIDSVNILKDYYNHRIILDDNVIYIIVNRSSFKHNNVWLTKTAVLKYSINNGKTQLDRVTEFFGKDVTIAREKNGISFIAKEQLFNYWGKWVQPYIMDIARADSGEAKAYTDTKTSEILTSKDMPWKWKIVFTDISCKDISIDDKASTLVSHYTISDTKMWVSSLHMMTDKPISYDDWKIYNIFSDNKKTTIQSVNTNTHEIQSYEIDNMSTIDGKPPYILNGKKITVLERQMSWKKRYYLATIFEKNNSLDIKLNELPSSVHTITNVSEKDWLLYITSEKKWAQFITILEPTSKGVKEIYSGNITTDRNWIILESLVPLKIDNASIVLVWLWYINKWTTNYGTVLNSDVIDISKQSLNNTLLIKLTGPQGYTPLLQNRNVDINSYFDMKNKKLYIPLFETSGRPWKWDEEIKDVFKWYKVFWFTDKTITFEKQYNFIGTINNVETILKKEYSEGKSPTPFLNTSNASIVIWANNKSYMLIDWLVFWEHNKDK